HRVACISITTETQYANRVLYDPVCVFSRYGDHRDRHSFPTRRSSDLSPTGALNGSWVDRYDLDPARMRRDHDRTLRLELRALVADRKSTRLNSSHDQISYAVFCLKKKKNKDASRTARPARDVALLPRS